MDNNGKFFTGRQFYCLPVFIIALIFIAQSVSAQEWEYFSNRPETENPRGILNINENIFVLGTNRNSVPNQGTDFESFFVKLDVEGNELDYKYYWKDADPHNYRLFHVTTVGDTIVGLVQHKPPGNYRQTIIIQVDEFGNRLSEHQIEIDSFYKVLPEGLYPLNGDTILIELRVTTDPSAPIDFKEFYLLSDKNYTFQIIKRKHFPPFNDAWIEPFGVDVINKNRFRVFSNVEDTVDQKFTLIEVFDMELNLISRHIIQREDARWFRDVMPFGDNYIVSGEIDTVFTGSLSHSYIAEMDSVGNLIREKINDCYTIGCTRSRIYNTVQDDQGNFYAMSEYWDNLNQDTYFEFSARLQKYDPDFNVEWDYILRPPEIQPAEMIMSNDGYLLVTGVQASDTFFGDVKDAYVAKIDLNGNLVDVSGPVREDKSISIFPNPSYGVINIGTYFTGSLRIFNNQGQEIQSEFLQQGKNIQINIDEPGIYFLQLINEKGRMIDVKKVVVIK